MRIKCGQNLWVKRNKPTRCNYSDVHNQTSISTCFGHHYDHHQDSKTVCYCVWCSALVVLSVGLWSCVISCVHCVKVTVHTAYDAAAHNHNQHNQCRTPYALAHGLALLMGIMMDETSWDRSLIINIRLVASCWFISLHPAFHDARWQEPKTWVKHVECWEFDRSVFKCCGLTDQTTEGQTT